MTDHIIYMDNAATTATRPEVLEAMLPYFTEHYGNPSSIHSVGRDARRAVEKARAQVAAALGAQPREIYFTAGGSESDNWAIRCASRALSAKGKHIITSQIEHHAVLHTCQYMEKQGYEVTYLPVDENGLVSVEDVKNAIRPDTVLISIMAANNEIGTIEPIREIGKVAHEAGVLFHTDAVQAVGAVPIDVNDWNVDMLSLSGHKFHAPKGIGALYIRSGLKLPPYILGGGQERGLRSGTEPVFLAAGFARAVELAQAEHEETLAHVRALSAQIRAELARLVPDAIVNSPEDASPFIVSVSVPGLRNAKSVAYLSDRGVYVSRASACESNHEHVAAGTWRKKHPLSLQAAGIPLSQGNTTLRVSFSGATMPDDVDRFVATLAECNAELGSRK